jgi:hypothetical protein
VLFGGLGLPLVLGASQDAPLRACGTNEGPGQGQSIAGVRCGGKIRRARVSAACLVQAVSSSTFDSWARPQPRQRRRAAVSKPHASTADKSVARQRYYLDG